MDKVAKSEQRLEARRIKRLLDQRSRSLVEFLDREMDLSTRIDSIAPDTVAIEIRDNDLTFAQLKQISEVLGTDLIDFSSETRDYGFCGTCSSPYACVIVRVRGVTKWPGEQHE